MITTLNEHSARLCRFLHDCPTDIYLGKTFWSGTSYDIYYRAGGRLIVVRWDCNESSSFGSCVAYAASIVDGDFGVLSSANPYMLGVALAQRNGLFSR